MKNHKRPRDPELDEAALEWEFSDWHLGHRGLENGPRKTDLAPLGSGFGSLKLHKTLKTPRCLPLAVDGNDDMAVRA